MLELTKVRSFFSVEWTFHFIKCLSISIVVIITEKTLVGLKLLKQQLLSHMLMFIVWCCHGVVHDLCFRFLNNVLLCFFHWHQVSFNKYTITQIFLGYHNNCHLRYSLCLYKSSPSPGALFMYLRILTPKSPSPYALLMYLRILTTTSP